MQADLHMNDTQYLLALTVSLYNPRIRSGWSEQIVIDFLLQLCCIRSSFERIPEEIASVDLVILIDAIVGYHDGGAE